MVAVLGLALLGVSLGSMAASADPTYSISGVVTDTSSTGVAGMTVALTEPGPTTVTTTTDSGGNYNFSNLAPGDYTVSTSTASGYTSASSGVVTIGTADLTNIDLAVTRFGVLSGKVTNGTGLPANSIEVYADYWDGSSWSTHGNISFAASDGTYSIQAVDTTGEYRIVFEINGYAVPFLTTYYGGSVDSPDPSTTTDPGIVNATAQADRSGLNVSLVGAGYITGTVKSDGIALAGEDIEAFDTITGDEYDAQASTDSNGAYSMKVRAGDPMEVGEGSDSDYYPQLYSGHDIDPSVFDPVTVSAGATKTGINFNLDPIAGSLLLVLDVEQDEGSSLPTQPANGARAELDITDNSGHLVQSSKSTVSNGFGFVIGSTPGNYAVKFTNSAGKRLAIEAVTSLGNTDPYFTPGSCSAYLGTLTQSDLDQNIGGVPLDFVLSPDLTICNAAPSIPQAPIQHHSFAFTTTTTPLAPTPIATSTPTPTPSPSASTAPTTSPKPKPSITPASSTDGLPWWVWLLIVVGVLVLVALGIVIFRIRS